MVTVPEPCIKADDSAPEYPESEIEFSDCAGSACLDDDELRAWINWRDETIDWTEDAETNCQEKPEEEETEDEAMGTD